MTIYERDKALDQEHVTRTGHSIHEARWALNPNYDPHATIPYEPSERTKIITNVIFITLFTIGYFYYAGLTGLYIILGLFGWVTLGFLTLFLVEWCNKHLYNHKLCSTEPEPGVIVIWPLFLAVLAIILPLTGLYYAALYLIRRVTP